MPTESKTVDLARDLIRRPSVTPHDEGCQGLLMDRLEAMGFRTVRLPFADVSNFWAMRGDSGPILCFAGHTDVVPPGNETDWQYPPFSATVVEGFLYGRGAADMKGSLAAMITACESFLDEHPDHQGRIAFLITSDEEGDAIHGTVQVVEWLREQEIRPDWCLIGEPSSASRLGDAIKIGRRGSLGGTLTVRGVAGHIAYPESTRNPIHLLAPALAELSAETWDAGNDYFPATGFQVSNIHSGTGTINVVPDKLEMQFNFRYSTEQTAETLMQRTSAILDKHGLDYGIDWMLNGDPFLTEPGELTAAVVDSILDITGLNAELSTTGGTSDGRFIAPMGVQVVELGPVNSSIHKVNESVEAASLNELSAIYRRVMEKLLL